MEYKMDLNKLRTDLQIMILSEYRINKSKGFRERMLDNIDDLFDGLQKKKKKATEPRLKRYGIYNKKTYYKRIEDATKSLKARLPDNTIKVMWELLPTTKHDLLKIERFGKTSFNVCGKHILAINKEFKNNLKEDEYELDDDIVKEFSDEHNLSLDDSKEILSSASSIN
jgi:hypothetical protein